MKTAIVCDWLVTRGGAENFLYHLIECFPDADVFAVIDFMDPAARQDILKNKPVTTSFLQKMPFVKKHYRTYLPLMPYAIEQLDVSAYDLVISSSHAVAKGIITGPDQIHISYVHSPMRYAWDLQHQYLRASGLNTGIRGWLAKKILHNMRIWDQRTANGVDYFIANSQFIARRIWKTYRREAEVIYPPINISAFTPCSQKENFYVTASRLVPYKKVDLLVESFATMPDKKLIVIGDGPDIAKIKAKTTRNIEILGYQTFAKLADYLRRAKAFVYAAEEDFGLSPLEAQASGTPVIAFGKGGILETVRSLQQEHPTGIFFKEQTVNSVCHAVREFEIHQDQFTAENCAAQAQQFTPERFYRQMKEFVNNKFFPSP